MSARKKGGSIPSVFNTLDSEQDVQKDGKQPVEQTREKDNNEESKQVSKPASQLASKFTSTKRKKEDRPREAMGTYIYSDLAKALDIFCALYDVQKWEVVCEALEQFLPDEVKRMAK